MNRPGIFKALNIAVIALLAMLLLDAGCDRDEGDDDDGGGKPEAQCIDADGDGFGENCDAGPDCDDADIDNWTTCACQDQDGDGWFLGCDAYFVRNGPDCDDADIDNWAACSKEDKDLDGYYTGCDAYSITPGPDCNDSNRLVYPNALEVCDGLDNQCPGSPGVGQIDEGCGLVSGGLTLPEGIVLDSDVKHPYNEPQPNDEFASAQYIVNTATVIGHADRDDQSDYFRVYLNQGDQVELKTASSISAKLDLFLYSADDLSLVDSSRLPLLFETDSVSASEEGWHYVRVNADIGGSLYNFKIIFAGGEEQGLLPSNVSDDDQFVIGEAVVMFKPAALNKSESELKSFAKKSADDLGAEIESMTNDGQALLSFPVGLSAKTSLTASSALSEAELKQARAATLEKIKQLSQNPDVAYAEPNYLRRANLKPDDPYYHLQWGPAMIHAEQAWEMTTGSPDAVVAVIDTGVLYDHPDLECNILMNGLTVVGQDMISLPAMALDGDGIDPDPYDPGGSLTGEDSSFHGTHVSGIIAACSNNQMGVAGMAWGAKIMPVRVLGLEGLGTSYDIAQGIRFAAGLANSSGARPMVGGEVKRADVINMSLGSSFYSIAECSAISAARSNGVIVVTSAGNEASSARQYPAACEGAIAVSALNNDGELAFYSSYGDYVDLAAPGGEFSGPPGDERAQGGILNLAGFDDSEGIDFGYVYMSGTSMASPHVAGVAALMVSAFKDAAGTGESLTPWFLDCLIAGKEEYFELGSITDYPVGQREPQKGYGRIEADKAAAAAKALGGGAVEIYDKIELEPKLLEFGYRANALTTRAYNRGFGDLEDVTVGEYQEDWLDHVQEGNTITFIIDRSRLDRVARDMLVAVSALNAGQAFVHINAAAQPDNESNAGYLIVRLLDPETGLQVYKTQTSFESGYRFSFGAVEPGQYLLVAGTDLDYDERYNEKGELYGYYSSEESPDSPALITVEQDNKVIYEPFIVELVGY